MSGFVRRLAIRMMKRAGYTRNKWIIETLPNGDKRPLTVVRDGEITDSNDNPIGRDWPLRLPADTMPPARARKPIVRSARGRRRGRRNKTYIEHRKALKARGEQVQQ